MPTKDGWPCAPTPDNVDPNPTWGDLAKYDRPPTPTEQELATFTHAIAEALIEDGHQAQIIGIDLHLQILVFTPARNFLIQVSLEKATATINEDSICPFITEEDKKERQFHIPLSDPALFKKLSHIIKTYTPPGTNNNPFHGAKTVSQKLDLMQKKT